MEKIGQFAFNGRDSLTSITIPDSITSIDGWAFQDCSGLTSITIPATVTNIECYAFHGCDNLTIYCEATVQPAGWDDNWNTDGRPVIWGVEHK